MDAMNKLSAMQYEQIKTLVEQRFKFFVNQKDFTQNVLFEFKKNLRRHIQTEYMPSGGPDLYW